jgi:hypothetical protein
MLFDKLVYKNAKANMRFHHIFSMKVVISAVLQLENIHHICKCSIVSLA